MKNRKKKALAELEDVHEAIKELFYETSKSRCGLECALEVADEQFATIRQGITKRKKSNQ